MAGELRLECLGGLQITLDGTPLTGFVSVKAPAVLCYLAVTGRPQFRLVLAGLLWGDLPEEDACANLRKVLSNLRALVGDYLRITPHTVTLDPARAYWLDVAEFLKRVEQEPDGPGDAATGGRPRELDRDGPAGRPRASVSPSLPALHEAAALYRGDFLEGFYVRHAPLFEEWVTGQREGLRRLAGRVFQRLADLHADRDECDVAMDYLARLLALEPWQEEAHRQMMALLARCGQRSAALAQYEMCRRLLKAELHVEPTAETTALYRRIRAAGARRSHNLPAPVTSFVGRAAELAWLADRLADPHCRLVSILGPGGVGKTRLALAAAAAARDRGDDAFLDGVFFIPLVNVHSAAGLMAALAAALGYACPAGADPQAELARRLRDRELLLVLDGFEHLMDEAGLLAAILQHAPGVKLLVASRQRLNLVGEWALDLAGLPYPPLGAAGEIATFDAPQLFLQRARQVDPTYAPTGLDLQAIILICELVEGLPLAIEFAASWVGTRRLLEIAQGIESGLDVLVAFWRDLPARHRSIRASFEHSWRLLSDAERRVFRRLAVFRGGFTCEAAEAVAGADLTLLTALTDRSLVRRPRSGRYEMHELLRLFAAEKLAQAPAEAEETRARHARYYLAAAGPPDGAQQAAEPPAERGNVQAARAWADEHGLAAGSVPAGHVLGRI